MTKLTCILWLIVMSIDILLPIVLAKFYKGYSQKTMALSVLGCTQSAKPIKWLYNLWCIVSGIVFCVSGYAIYTIYGGGLSIAVWVLLAIYGFGCEILSGIFPTNESKEDKSISSQIHGVGSAIGFTLLVFAPLLLGIKAFQTQNTAIGVSGIISFILAFIAFIFFIVGEKRKFEDTILSYGGLWQRVVLVITYIPFIIFCIESTL